MADRNLTETPTFDASSPVPSPGDAVRAGGTSPGSVQKVEQALLDRTQYLRAGAEQSIATSLIPDVKILSIPTLVTISLPTNIGIWQDSGQTTLNYGTLGTLTAAPPVGGVGNLYYFYAIRTGSGSNPAQAVIGLEVSLTGPEPLLNFKTSDVTKRYLGFAYCVDAAVTGGAAGAPSWMPARCERGHTVYQIETNLSPQNLLDNAAGAGWSTIPLALMPLGAKKLDLFGVVASQGGDAGAALQVRRTGLTYEARTICQKPRDPPPYIVPLAGPVVTLLATGGGAITLTGAQIGDAVIMATDLTAPVSLLVWFESLITVTDEIQQLATALPGGTGAGNRIQVMLQRNAQGTRTPGTIEVLLDDGYSFDWRTTTTVGITVTLTIVGIHQ